MTTPDPGLTAALLKITECAERLALLENRVSGNLNNCEMTTAGLGGAITDLRALVEEQGGLLESVSELVKTLAPPPDDKPAPGYTPRPSVHWWTIKDDERQKAVGHLAAWVEQVYRPFYGHLAVMLGACWAEHPLCLTGLDVLSELHSVLWFQPKRSASLLSAQAEYNTRILPATAELLRAETSRCNHNRRPTANGSAWRGAQ